MKNSTFGLQRRSDFLPASARNITPTSPAKVKVGDSAPIARLANFNTPARGRAHGSRGGRIPSAVRHDASAARSTKA